MNLLKDKIFSWSIVSIVIMLFLIPMYSHAQSYQNWYNSAQSRIDTLRKGDFAIKVIDESGEPYSGAVSVQLKKHEFPFGIAFDFYEGAGSMGNSFSTGSIIQAETDFEIYQTERWSDYLAYSIPTESGKEYKLTLKFAEIYANESNVRLFDVKVDGELFLDDYDVFLEADGKDIAIDTSITLTKTNNALQVELLAVKDNAMIKGMVIEAVDGSSMVRINCGGQELTTSDGNQYVSENGFFDPDVNTVASNEQWMQAAMYKYFNYGVSGNSFKWSGIQPEHKAPDYTNFENAVNWAQKVDWDIRAHTLLWGKDGNHEMPNWIRELPTPEAITDTCKMRVQRDVARYKGIIKEYDVINEPLTDHADWLRNTVGDSILWNCFKWAREVDSEAELFINDYNVEYNWGQAEEYRDLVLEIIENGGPVTGVGLQAHFWDCCRPNVDELVKNINIIAETGLPLRLTEYDWGTDLTEKQQVKDFMMVATIAFSHPSVNGMICWGLSDRGAWRENTGFFDSNYRPKLAADTLLYLTKTKWATNFDSVFSGSEAMSFKAFYGDYDVEVTVDGVKKVLSVPCYKENRDSVFILNLNDAKLKGPQLLNAVLTYDNEVTLTFDKAVDERSLKRSDFKFFSSLEIGLEDVIIDPSNENNLILLLNKNVDDGVYTSVAYFPGNLKANDGSLAEAFGPETVNVLDDTSVRDELADLGLKIYPNPASKVVNISQKDFPYAIEIFNALGMRVYAEYVEAENTSMDVNHLKRGIYLIKVSNNQNCTTTRKIILE